jgi:ABC-2 type transport system permease protein
MSILATGIFSIGVAVTEERRDGTLKTFMASPIRFSSYLIGHILSRVAALVAGVLVMLVVAVVRYDVALQSSWGLFLIVAALATATMLSLGFLLASRSQKTESAGAIGSLLFIVGLISVTVDVDAVPDIARYVLNALPFEAMIQALRGSWAGEGIATIARHIAVLGAWFAVLAFGASRWFRWSLTRS